jgi:hypothetical protein
MSKVFSVSRMRLWTGYGRPDILIIGRAWIYSSSELVNRGELMRRGASGAWQGWTVPGSAMCLRTFLHPFQLTIVDFKFSSSYSYLFTHLLGLRPQVPRTACMRSCGRSSRHRCRSGSCAPRGMALFVQTDEFTRVRATKVEYEEC